MEQHETDPKASEDPWTNVTTEFGGLSERIKRTYQKVATDGGPSEEEVKDAVSILIGAWGHVAEAFSTALRDRDTREHLKRAAGSFATAVGSTIADLGIEIRKDEHSVSSESEIPVEDGGTGGGVVNGDGEPPT